MFADGVERSLTQNINLENTIENAICIESGLSSVESLEKKRVGKKLL